MKEQNEIIEVEKKKNEDQFQQIQQLTNEVQELKKLVRDIINTKRKN